MEPTDLNPPPPDDAQLEAWLRTSTSQPLLADDGFTQRVLTALPSRTNRQSVQRSWFCLGGALVGIVVAILGAFQSRGLPARFPAVKEEVLVAVAQLSVPAVGLALGIAAVSLWFAFRDRVRLLPRL